jgi:hypothetical protein
LASITATTQGIPVTVSHSRYRFVVALLQATVSNWDRVLPFADRAMWRPVIVSFAVLLVGVLVELLLF